MIAVLLCACASLPSGRRVLTAAEVEANYQEFYKELNSEQKEPAIGPNTDHYAKAKAIADQKKVNRGRVVKAVTTVMWQKVILTKEIGVGEAKDISKMFQLDSATETDFALKVFNFLVTNDLCETAADLVVSFNMGSAYADKAINCAQASPGADYVKVAHLACRRPGTKELQSKLINDWVENFKRTLPDQRDYDPIGVIAAICPLTADQYSELFAIVLKDKKVSFAKAILEKDSFKKIPADYDNFIAMAVAEYECGMAATVAIKYKLFDTAVEAIFLNRKCLGGTLGEVDPVLVPKPKAEWFFDLSLRAQEFGLARRAIKTFSFLGKDYFDKAVREGLKVHDYDEVLLFEPWDGERAQDYRDDILNKILDAGEEWAVTRFVVWHPDLFSGTHKIAWNERAYLHAFRRGVYDLAANIAHSDTRADFKDWGIRLAFDAALKAKNADMARFIAKSYHLDKDALRRVAMLYFELNKEKDREKARQQAEKIKRECKSVKDWKVEQCK